MIHLTPATHVLKITTPYKAKLLAICKEYLDEYFDYFTVKIKYPMEDGTTVILKCTRGKVTKVELFEVDKNNSSMS